MIIPIRITPGVLSDNPLNQNIRSNKIYIKGESNANEF